MVFVGDSLGEQTAPYLAQLIAPIVLTPQVFGGTAPCDWLGKDLQIMSGSVVVVSFTGNATTACMADASGADLQGAGIVERYRTDVTALIAVARTAGATVLLVGQPVHVDTMGGNDVVAGINAAFMDLAGDPDVAYVDAGAAVENPDGTYAAALPCLPKEAECDPSGNNVVRNDDGLHFCPGSPPPGPCAVYSSGAFRVAKAIADAITG